MAYQSLKMGMMWDTASSLRLSNYDVIQLGPLLAGLLKVIGILESSH